MFAGALAAALLLSAAGWGVSLLVPPPVLRMEHGVIYQGLVLGAGFGAVCGALAGFARALGRPVVQERVAAVPPASPAGRP
jgi:hypothetical protein